MKRLAFLIAALAIALCSCAHPREIQLSKEMMSEGALSDEESGEIMRCLQENDRDGFKALFCEKARSEDGFDGRVDHIFELIGTDHISCEFDMKDGGSGKSVQHGETTDWHIDPWIEYITFSYDGGDGSVTKKYFEIRYFWQLAKKDKPDEVGIQEMRFMYLNVETVELGDHYS